MNWLRMPMVAGLLLLGAIQAGHAEIRGSIGVLGDSYSDEYQFYPPDRSTARNWVEILAAARGLNFGAFSEAGRGEPRNQGYEFNWARSDATTDDLIATGQHTGLAAQVARGEVGLVVVYIGGNDFIHAMQSPDPMEALARVRSRALANYRTAVETILRADPEVKVVLATISDIRNLPEFAGPIRSGRLPRTVADACTAAIGEFNGQIRALASADRRIALLDLDLATRVANLASRNSVTVSGIRLDRSRPGNGLEDFFLADSRHPGTIGQGLLAKMFVDTINARFDAGIAPLAETEIVQLARSAIVQPPRSLAGRMAP